jgi:hypothetical protein
MARAIWCGKCDAGYLSVAGDVPRICPHCRSETVWRTLAPASAAVGPVKPYELTPLYSSFLASIRIAAD